jgi:dienelactone hydrolase
MILSKLICVIAAGLIAGFTAVASAQSAEAPLPVAIAPYFTPPAAYAERFGDFRSPLQFDNGTVVKTAADWPRRREEIAKYWNGIMGPWPELLKRGTFEVLKNERRENFSQQRVKVETAPGQKQEGWLLTPDGNGPFPAVLVVFYEPETSTGLNADEKHRFRDYALQLTRRGFVTLSIGSPGGDARNPALGDAICQPLSFHAYVAANCWHALANHPKVDRERIGVVGHSYGGKWALFAAALWDKFAAVAVSDPGIVWDETRSNVNYWEPWYLGLDPSQPKRKPGVITDINPRTGAYAKLIEAKRDLTDIHALICPRPFFVSGGSEDPPERWVALNHAIRVNELLGFNHRVGMTNRPAHSPTEEANAIVWAFFEHFLGKK